MDNKNDVILDIHHIDIYDLNKLFSFIFYISLQKKSGQKNLN